jgi:hypothetical protein
MVCSLLGSLTGRAVCRFEENELVGGDGDRPVLMYCGRLHEGFACDSEWASTVMSRYDHTRSLRWGRGIIFLEL